MGPIRDFLVEILLNIIFVGPTVARMVSKSDFEAYSVALSNELF